jgi:hypothetical protein
MSTACRSISTTRYDGAGRGDGTPRENRPPGGVPVSISLAAKRWTIALDEAKAAVAGYAFAVCEVGDELAPRWAYRTYDCIPASPGPDFSDLDILVAAGLNGELDVAAIGALQLATRRGRTIPGPGRGPGTGVRQADG